MQLLFRHAVVSFCGDLTRGDAKSVPLAVLLVGRVEEDRGVAVVVARTEPPKDVDPISAAMIQDLSDVIKRHVDQTRVEDGIDPTSVIHSFEQSLRNSIHVSLVSDEASVELPATATAREVVTKAMDQAWEAAQAAFVVEQTPTQKRETQLPATSSWEVPRRRPAPALAATA